MTNLLKFLCTKDEIYKDIIITSVEFLTKQNLLRIKLQYTCDVFSDVDRENLETYILEYFGNSFELECKIKKYLIDEDVIKYYVFKYIQENHPSVCINGNISILVNAIESGLYKIKIGLSVENFAYLKALLIEEKLTDYLVTITKEEYEIELYELEQDKFSNIDILEERYQMLNSSDNIKIIDYDPIEIKSIENIIGQVDVDFVYPIASFTSADKVVLAGTISHLRVSEYESKYKNKDGTARISKRVNFLLNDGSEKMSCVYFPVIADLEKIDKIEEGMKIVAIGDLDDRDDRLSCKVKSIAKCEFEPYEKKEKPIELKTVNSNYMYIFPKVYEKTTQSDFLTTSEKIDKFLMENEVVVFDLETTGLNVNECEIIEIGAVKMRNGEVIETFDTLIKPKAPIPPDATAINNITDEMVSECLGIEKVFPDFYKFIDGCVLVAYNIEYDYGCLKAYGDKNGYVINNRQVDALKLAKKALPEYKSHKLGKVVKVLNITLDNAHRALFDTIATAEVLKVTLNMLTDEDKRLLLN